MTSADMRGHFLEAMLASATDYAIVAFDLDGILTVWNEGAYRIMGWTEAEIVGRPIHTFFTEEDRENGIPEAEMEAAALTGRGTDERWHARRDGSRFWASGEMMPVRDAVGLHVGYLKILRDRTRERLETERQRADAEFLHSLLAASADCIKVLDLDGSLAFMNEGGQRLMEISDFNAVKGCPWPDFLQGTGTARAHEAMDVAKAGGVGRFQGSVDTMEGRLKHWDVQVTPILGSDGKPDKLLAVSRDVTAISAAEDALREAQGLNAPVLRSSRDCIVVLDLDGNTRFVSPGGIEAMEITEPAAVIGQSWLRVWHGKDNDAARSAVANGRAGGIGRFHGFCPTHKGTPKWWDVVISPLAGVDGRPEGLVSIARDVTAQHNAEMLLRESEERRRLAVEAGDIGTWSFDARSRSLHWDERCRVLFGMPPAAPATYEACLEGVHPDDRERVLTATRAAYGSAEQASFQIEYRTIGLSDGIERWIAVAGKAHFAGGQATRLVGTVMDITARKDAEQQARLFGDELQHRVKNTLAIVQAIVRQTLRNAASPAEAQAAVDPRLAALATANDMLTLEDWKGSGLQQTAEAALMAHDDGSPERILISGPAVWLSAQATMSLALMLNELATNATKYGALSAPQGKVELTWTVDPTNDRDGLQSLHLVWREHGGPPVRPPAKRGFGSKLIEGGLANALRGKAALTFPESGVTCTVDGHFAAAPTAWNETDTA